MKDFELTSELAISTVQENRQVLSLIPGEEGTCKKVLHLGPALSRPELHKVALAQMKTCTPHDEALCKDEHCYLTYLRQAGYPVVPLLSEVFAMQTSEGQSRYGMLMEYIENAVFIEAKTPTSLNLLIFAALIGQDKLGIQVRPQEMWLPLHEQDLTAKIKSALKNTDLFRLFQQNAQTLRNQLADLIQKLRAEQIAIVDLQMLITNDGKLTIIDPLDVVQFGKDFPNPISVLHPDRKPQTDFISSLKSASKWLNEAHFLCQTISQAPNYLSLEPLICLHPRISLRFSDADPKGKSRIAKLVQQNLSVTPNYNKPY